MFGVVQFVRFDLRSGFDWLGLRLSSVLFRIGMSLVTFGIVPFKLELVQF